MNFSGKISKSLMGGTLGFTLAFSALLTTVQPSVVRSAAVKIAQTLSPEEVNLRAKQIIVRIDGAGIGSGSLIESSNNTYTVLTNWHVVKNQGAYVVRTIDGRKHEVDPASIKQIGGLDLAILRFTSNQNYQIAELGNPASLNEGQSVYFAGYPGELRKEDNRYYRFFSASLVGILPKSTENGYSLIYNGEAFPGMSGGPVFNRDGLMIGVHGEANVHALSGGTSNYAIPIDAYQTAVANSNQQPQPAPTPANPTATPPSNEVVTQTETSPASSEPATPAEPPATQSSPTPVDSNTTATEGSNTVSSVPTFVPEPTPEAQPEAENSPEAATENAIANEPEISKVESEIIEVTTAGNTRKVALVSEKTGIDYTSLRDLLKAQKWSEADLQTYKLVEQIVQTAKQRNKHYFIELKTIAEFSCPDIRTIDSLWTKYTGNKFGFSSQQEVWQSVNQKGDFSTQTWRSFATQVGWKEGDVSSGSGYLLYEQLDFDPTQAPTGHLPWWFALPDEEQNVIKHLFARCNFNPTPQELAAEEGGDKPGKPQKNPEINKQPK
ncbi:MAG: GUN4 domain-containing protein [Cyanobacteria bacterium P01_G01_bin.19]